mgnify:CR=1 FL=1
MKLSAMKLKFAKIYLIISLIGLFGQVMAQEYTLEKSGDTNIQIDFETSFNGSGFIEDEEHYYFLDGNSDNIHIAIINKSNLVQIDNIYLYKEGPSGIKNPMSLVLIDKNIGVYEFYSGKIKVIDKEGKVLKTFETKKNNPSSIGVMPLFMNPILNLDQQLIITQIAGIDYQTGLINYTNPVIKFFDLPTEKQTSILNYPENYKNPLAGGRHSFFSYTKNDNEKELVVSFPIDHNLYHIKNKQIKKVKVEGAIFESFENHYFGSFGDLKDLDYNKIKWKFWNSHSYGLLVFDPYREVYYREVKLPIKNPESLPQDAKEGKHRDYVILIYDKDFKFLGKSGIIENVNLTMSGGNYFISKAGLHLFKADQDNEDLMQFNTYKLKRK